MDYATSFPNHLLPQEPHTREIQTHYFLSNEPGFFEAFRELQNGQPSLPHPGFRLKLLILTQRICLFLFIALLTLTLTFFPVWKKNFHAQNLFQNLWAPFWLLLTLCRFLLLTMTVNLRRTGRPIHSLLTYSQRCLQCLALVWFLYGIKPLFWDPPDDEHIVRLARGLWLIQAIFLLIPFLFYIIICFCVPCLLILRYRLRPREWTDTPTPSSILSKLEVRKYKDLSEDIRRQTGQFENDYVLIWRCSLKVSQQLLMLSDCFVFPSHLHQDSQHVLKKDDPLIGKTSSLQQAGRFESSSRHITGVEKSCPICMIDFDDMDEVMIMPCDKRHFFHVECVRLWLHSSQYCAICRANVVEEVSNKELACGSKEQNALHDESMA